MDEKLNYLRANACPDWYDGTQINELKMLSQLQATRGYRWIEGMFYDREGNEVSEKSVQYAIVLELERVMKSRLCPRSKDLLNLAKVQWNREPPKVSDEKIYLTNGVYDTRTDTFSEHCQFSRHRLNVAYNPEAPTPEVFLAFLRDLLEPEDLLTVQEYLGYCLIPTTKAQKMLTLMGKGGEGKSVLGQVVAAIWGQSASFSSIQKISTNQFARADLEGKLVMVDDDMALEALTQTHYLKTLITLEGKTDVERKGIQSYQTQLYARFLGLSNGFPTALYDRSDGFFRRMLLVSVKERPADRESDPYLADRLKEEAEGIFLWCLEGLNRLYEQNYQFTISQQTRQNLKEAIVEADPISDFLASSGYIRFDQEGWITSADLYQLFKIYCQDNVKTPLSDKTFERRVRGHLLKRNVRPTTHVPNHRRSIRGYLGICAAMPPGWMGG